MPDLRPVPTGDYWSSDTEPGASQSWVFDGAEGLARLSGPSIYTAPLSAGFRARLTRVQLDHVAVEAFGATRHRAVRGEDELVRHPTPVLSFVFVSDGELRVELRESAFVLQAGQFTVVDSRDPVTFVAPDDVKMLKSVVGVDHVPEFLQQRGTTIPGALHRTALTESFVAFLSAVLRASTAGRPVQGLQLVQAVADLQNSVLAEAQRVTTVPTGPAGLRYRMEEYIEAHLTDRDLGPAAVANALEISLRHAHGVFNDGERTISRYIRDRKLARIALTLRTSHDPIQLADLAVQYDFPNVEGMSRAFRERYGTPPADYRADSHQKLG